MAASQDSAGRVAARAYERLAATLDGWWNRLFGLPEAVLTAAQCEARPCDAAGLRAAKQTEYLSNCRAAMRVPHEAAGPILVAEPGEACGVIATIGPNVAIDGGPTSMRGEMYTTAHTMREQADELYAFLMANAPDEAAALIDSVSQSFELRRQRLRVSSIKSVLTDGGQLKRLVAEDFVGMVAVLGMVGVIDRHNLSKKGPK